MLRTVLLDRGDLVLLLVLNINYAHLSDRRVVFVELLVQGSLGADA